MSQFVAGMTCAACGRRAALQPTQVCPDCFGPLEVAYDYDAVRRVVSREAIAARSRTLWRLHELLPLLGPARPETSVGFTPLVRAERLARALGVAELYVKDETASPLSGSFKDRLVAVALAKAREFGLKTVACSTTGNLGLALAAQAPHAGFRCVVFVPAATPESLSVAMSAQGAHVVRVDGDYDRVNRLCVEVADRYGWAFVNVNLKPYYAEGSKTIGFEIAEQLGWRAPTHLVAPMGSGSLLIKMGQALRECERVGLLPEAHTRLHGAQAAGCAPIVAAVNAGSDAVRPVRPNTSAHSIAIGDPGDGPLAARAILDTGGSADEASESETAAAMHLLAETEGIRAEPAGGVAVAVTQKLIQQGKIERDAPVVICVTGRERMLPPSPTPHPLPTIPASLRDFANLCRERGWNGDG